MATKKKKGGSGLGLAALAAATAAGVYFLYGSKNAPKNRIAVKGWMLKARGEVMEKMEKMRRIDEKDYRRVVNTVASKYKKLKDVNMKEVDSLVKDLNDQWKNISAEAGEKSSKK